MAIARFLYDNCIPFNVVNSMYYQKMIDAVATAGPGYKAPSYHVVWVPLLRDQKKEVQLLVESQHRHWAEVGCTLMADGWTDTRHRSLINFLVYCPRGMVFVKSVDASDIVKSTRNLYKLFDEVVTWVGPKNIVHMVTDNASNYVSAGKLLCEKYKTISWSPCAAHCLNLVLQDMGDMPHVERLKKRASKVTVFIYNHVALIAWLRKRPGWTDIVRVGATRFATTFLSFGSLHVHKHDLQALVTSKFFVDNRLAKESKAKKKVVSIILDNSFWDDINVLVKISSLLIRLLRIVDSDQRPAIGYVYEGMHRAWLGIKKIFRMKKHLYKPYTSIIKNRWDKHLRKDLHAAAYWLNPAFQYDEENFCRKPAVHMVVLDYIGTKYDGDKEKVIKETQYFRDRIGSFDRELALSTSTTTHPEEWWKLWGANAPNLQKLAIRILSQTSASSGCERCWSLFDQIHSKRRNKLEHQRLNDLVFVHHNLRLKHRLYNKKFNFDPIDYASIDKTDFWVFVEEEDPYLNYEELENAIYEEGAYPASAGPSFNIEESVDDSSEVEGIDLGTFGQPVGPPPRFPGNDDEHDDLDIDDL
ncbi:uncharacterized protein LOC126692036 isoform X1 [Quercus robur]|uniref:uncharacterized protein LOC126692036 isoform X1 n=1 Tax=Quercus robur TaxID=38942 RepID=UPI002163376F|nr:uncharacterized protein LOC126692036 isoform X1 [Quercus robur]